MKPCSEWDENYLLSLPVGEHDYFEAKGRKPLDLTLPGSKESDLRTMLSRQLSAFSNSGGGAIVMGLSNPKASGTKWAIDDGGVALEGPKGSVREWLEDIIPNLVEHPLGAFNVHAVQGSERSSILAGRAVFVIDVPDSVDAPHMADDKRYYARVAGKSRPLSHRLVLDILNRAKHAKLQLEFWIERRWEREDPVGFLVAGSDYEWKSYFCVNCKNTGAILAHYVTLRLGYKFYLLPEETRKIKGSSISDQERFESIKRNTRRDLIRYDFPKKEYGPSWFDPILPGMSRDWEMEIDDTVVCAIQNSDVIEWELFIDSAPAQIGTVSLERLEVQETDNS